MLYGSVICRESKIKEVKQVVCRCRLGGKEAALSDSILLRDRIGVYPTSSGDTGRPKTVSYRKENTSTAFIPVMIGSKGQRA
jgi:hypothetical protein